MSVELRWRHVFSALLAVAAMSGCARAPNMPAGPEAYSVMAPRPGDIDPAYRMGPGDKVSVLVYGQADMSVPDVTIDPQGLVSLPLVGPRTAGGKTASEFASEVEGILGPRYLVEPHVSVNIIEYSSKFVTIDGEIARPGTLPVSGSSTLVNVVARAGGPNRLAKLNQVAVFREVNGRRMAARFDLKAIRRGEAADPVILANDTIIIGFDHLQGAYRDVLASVPIIGIFRFF